ncbi:MAG TPA: cupin domain-containing protein [Phycisphaerae bacterium]|nr:cupin domain-containing protein [Phycisphaerae bacterium]
MANYLVAQLDALEASPCPCGSSRRAFVGPDNPTASVHLVEIAAQTQVHWHRKMTEVYVVLEGEGHVELDGERVPVRPMTAVMIRPGCRHRAVGRLKILNVVIPPFDPADEYAD